MPKIQSSLRGGASQRGNPFFWIASLVLAIMLFLSTQAMAQDNHTYSPEHCDFAVTFPSEPYETRRCDEKGQNCYDLISYTQVFDMAATVNFRVICNATDQEIYKAYDESIMRGTLRAMTKRSVVNTFSTSYREEDGYKQAGLAGEGRTGNTPNIYIAQLWMSPNSTLSVEAELIGEDHEAADTLFGDILRSVQFKPAKTPAPESAQP